jgi:hypothetical protein
MNRVEWCQNKGQPGKEPYVMNKHQPPLNITFNDDGWLRRIVTFMKDVFGAIANAIFQCFH